MISLWLWSCLIVGLCSAHCNRENTITGDADISGGPLEKKLERVLNDLLNDVQCEDFEKIRELYYTKDVIQVIQGEAEIQKGKSHIEERLRRIIPPRAFWQIEFSDYGELDKTTAYSSIETRYYKDKNLKSNPKPIYRLVILWKMEDKKWKIDQIALNDDGAQCGQLTL